MYLKIGVILLLWNIGGSGEMPRCFMPSWCKAIRKHGNRDNIKPSALLPPTFSPYGENSIGSEKGGLT